MGECYRLIFPDGRSYIGCTTRTAWKRWLHHVCYAPKCRMLVAQAIVKFGAENVRLRILARSSDHAALKSLERFYVHDLRTKYPDGYNLADGGGGTPGFERWPEWRAKVSQSLKGNRNGAGNKGQPRPQTPEWIAKATLARMGHPVSPETRRKLSLSNIGKHVPTEETRAKMRASRLRFLGRLPEGG